MESVDLETLGGRGRFRRIILAALVVALVVVGFLAYLLLFSDGDGDTQALNTHKVRTATIRSSLTTSGVAEAVDDTVLSFGISGRVASVDIKLGEEVTTGQKLATLETEDLQNSLDMAQANLASARIRLKQLEDGPTDAQIAAAQEGVQTAQTALDKALNTQKDLLDGPDDAEIAAAEDAVQSAQAALDRARNTQKDLLDGPDDAEMAAAQDAVDSAQSALLAAQDRLTDLEEGPSDADLAAAESKVASAEASLASAENLHVSAKAAVQAAEADLQGAGTTYCDTEDHLHQICNPFSIPLSTTDVSDLNASIGPDADDSPSDQLVLATTALVGANSAYRKAVSSRSDAKAGVDAAQAAVDSAQEALDALKEPPDQADLDVAQAAVTAAEQTLETAKLAQDKLLAGPTEIDLANAQSAVTAAEQTLQAAQLAQDKLLAGPTDIDLANAQSAVDSARAALSAAIAARDDVLAGATQEEMDLQVQQVRLAELDVARAESALEDAVLTAPFEGTVAAINVSVGEVVGPSVPAISLLNPDAMRVKLTLGETDLPPLKLGQTGLIIFDAIQGVPFSITITKIGLAPETSQGVVTYTAEADLNDLDSAEQRPVPGMNGAAVIITGEKADVLVVPSRAIRRQGTNQVVDALVNGKSETRVIQTGASDAENVEILSGLKEGDTIILPGRAPTGEEAEEEEEENVIPEGIR